MLNLNDGGGHQPRVIVIGSGFHRQVMGEAKSLLSSWEELMSLLSHKHSVDLPCELAKNDPVIAWEYLVAEVAREQFGETKSSRWFEQRLKRDVCQMIKNAEKSRRYDQNYKIITAIRENLQRGGLHLVSLNFDSLAYGKIAHSASLRQQIAIRANTGLRDRDYRLLYERKTVSSDGLISAIWHPHGHVKRASSITLGMRDYGFLPHSYSTAFNHFKSWERRISANLEGEKKHQKLHSELRRMDENPPLIKAPNPADNWVTRFMIYPVTFIGVGLSQVEIGMRWLLVQRARNFRKMADSKIPKVIFHSEDHLSIPQVECRIKNNDEPWGKVWESVFSMKD